MGEMADFVLDSCSDEEFELGMYYFTRPRRKPRPSGPGKCPVCGKETVLKNGKFGEFFGCTDFPTCKGNRNKG